MLMQVKNGSFIFIDTRLDCLYVPMTGDSGLEFINVVYDQL